MESQIYEPKTSLSLQKVPYITYSIQQKSHFSMDIQFKNTFLLFYIPRNTISESLGLTNRRKKLEAKKLHIPKLFLVLCVFFRLPSGGALLSFKFKLYVKMKKYVFCMFYHISASFFLHRSRSQLNIHIISHLEGNCGRVFVYAKSSGKISLSFVQVRKFLWGCYVGFGRCLLS